MSNAVRAEFLKIRKRPATWVLLGLVITDLVFWQYFLSYGRWLQIKGHVVASSAISRNPLSQPFSTLQVVRAVVDQLPVFTIIVLILGALVAGSGYSWGTVKTDYSAGQPRVVIFAAQFLVLAALFAPLVALLFAVAVGLTFILSSVEHFPVLWPPTWQFAAAMGAVYLNLVVNMAYGMMLASLVRSAAVGVGLGLGPISVLTDIPGLIGGPAVQTFEQQWLPWSAAFSLINVFGPLGGGPTEVMGGTPGNAAVPALVAAGCTIGFLLVAATVLKRRDVR